ncbi:MAG: 50S ribosomal protein L10 [Flavobacteriales bacterium]
MTRQEKDALISDLADRLSKSEVVYLTDIASLDAENSSKLRRLCFQRDVQLQVVKNTLLQKAMERVDGKNYGDLPSVLKGNTGLMIAEAGNAPAKLIQEFRKKSDKPILKGAYIQESIYVGDNLLDALANLKSKDELIGDIILLLQSPAKNVVSGLKSGGGKLAGILKTLENRAA